MLRRAICSSDGRSRSLVHRSLARHLRQYSILNSRPTGDKLLKPPIWSLNRTASTQNDGANDTQRAAEAQGTDQEDVNLQPSIAEEHTATSVEDAAHEAAFRRTRSAALQRRFSFPKEEPGSDELETLEDVEANAHGNAHFLPIREGLREEVQSVATSLSDLIEQMKAQSESESRSSKVLIEEEVIPLSPLEKVLIRKDPELPLSPLETVSIRKRRTPKPQPTAEEEMRLSYNPWAMMLAGKIRLDTASKLRYPESLLLTLGEVANPHDESVYLLPDDLANLEVFDWRLQRALRRNAWRDPLRTRGGSQIRVLPSQSLLDELTEELVVWDSKTKSGRTRNGIIAKRLLPPRWLERNQRINAYQAASTEYWKIKQQQQQKDVLDDPAAGKEETTVDLTALQWQPNVAERILWIMRQRLILSLDHLGRKISNPNDRWKSFKFIQCFKWPDSLLLDLTTEIGQEHNFVLASCDDPQHAEVGAESEALRLRPFAKQVKAPGAEHSYRHNNPDFWLPGSYFIHVGPPETTLTALSSLQAHQPSPEGQLQAPISISKLNPPMIAAADVRLPVFNLPALLGPKFDHLLQQILTARNMTLSQNQSDDLSKQNYLIHIRATAPNSHLLLKELWQLWRYVGGTDCLQPQAKEPIQTPSMMDLLKDTAKTDTRKEKDRIKRFKMNKRSWDNLYSFLPGIERGSDDG